MSSITIRNVPEDVKARLARRAEQSGESLEAFVRRLFQAEAARTPLEKDWSTFVRELAERVKSLPPLEPGDKDAWEHSEDLARRDRPLSAP